MNHKGMDELETYQYLEYDLLMKVLVLASISIYSDTSKYRNIFYFNTF
jgi:hypothetical protein